MAGTGNLPTRGRPYVTLQADLIAANEEVAAKQARMAELLKDINDLPADKARERADAIKSANTELADLGEKRDKLERTSSRSSGRARPSRPRGACRPARSSPRTRTRRDEDIYSTGVKSVRDLLKNEALPGGDQGRREVPRLLGELAVKTLITSADLTPAGRPLPRSSGRTRPRSGRSPT
jgi:hypothetical protein